MTMLRRGFFLLLAGLLVWPFVLRTYDSLRITPQASTNIYEQQFQMARFLKRYYPAGAVAINDIGAISFFTDASLVDLAGLGTMETAHAKLSGSYSTKTLRDLARLKDVKVAIVYEHWYAQYGGLPTEWEKVGEWKVRDNVVLGRDRVAFLVVDPTEKHPLIQHLKDFSTQLPPDVEERHGESLGDWNP